MSMLTEYLLWKSINQKGPGSSVKQEFVDVEVHTKCKLEDAEAAFDGDNNMICRICTNAAEIPVTNSFDGFLIMSAIRTVANISISETDFYPKYVCARCLEELKIAFYFKRRCEKSDIMFRKTITPDTTLTTSYQPMIMHDFELILEQMKQRRLALNNVLVKTNASQNYNDDDENDESNYEDETISPVKAKPTVEKKVRKAKRACKKKKSALSRRTEERRILKILKTQEKVSKKKWTISDTQMLKKIKSNVKKVRELKCKSCDIKFDTQVAMLEHKRKNCHIYHPCPLCGKLVLNLTQHKNVVHYRPNKYTCHQCGKIYYSPGALANHLYVHKEAMEYCCDLCPYKGKRKAYLVVHMRVHTGDAHRYLCSMCPLKFTNPSNLRKHQLIHSVKQFQCTKCKKLFRQQKIMQEHYDSVHMNIRYRCSICGRDLSTRRKLLTHELRVHKREKHKLFQEQQKVIINNEND